MDFALQPCTTSGLRFAELAENHATDFAIRAAQHDLEGSFPFENVEAMQRSGVMGACVPVEFAGLGVESLHDVMLGISRLGRGDGSTAIGTAMHLLSSWVITRGWRSATAAGDTPLAERMASLLRRIAAGETVLCSPQSEPGTDMLHPLVEATNVTDGWRLNGRKIFGTFSPAASLFAISCRVGNQSVGFRRVMAMVPAGSLGMVVKNNWDALGMRGSGSHDIVFQDCFVPEGAVRDDCPWGEWSERSLSGQMAFNMGLVGAFLGIAEAARDLAITAVTSRRRGSSGPLQSDRPAIQHLIGEIEIDLAAARAILSRNATTVDAFFSRHPAGTAPLSELHALMKDFQCAKWFVNRKAIEIIDRAMAASGGAGYLSTNPLSRLYRDVRAGPFMQLFSPNEAFGYIGKVTLGIDPALAD
ncbi:MAG TPA: acyl-CoA dehydrogenase family protein [Acetobacteraceae bacterium]|nr:acyl-CoA dehydrogenase family protein [Acetobacteraceae bacterium]